MKNYFVYILTNKLNKVLYIGVTSNLMARDWQHKNKVFEGFTKKYNVNKLVYYEMFSNIEDAIRGEKKLKNWHRQWKINLINKSNSEWRDLSDDFYD